MKKIIAIITALMLCAAIMVPAFAVDDFVSSVVNPLAPEIVPVIDPNGDPAAGVVVIQDEIIDYVPGPCIEVTPVSRADTSTMIPEDARELLLDVYAQLTSGQMQLPYWKHDAGLDPEDMVIRDLFDVTFLCEEHSEMLDPIGVTFRITFDLGVESDAEVYAMTYKRGVWEPVVSCVNNGNGTVTVVAEKFCPLEFSVEVKGEEPEDPTCPDWTWPSRPDWTWPTLPEVTWPTCPEKPTCPKPTFPTCPEKPTCPQPSWPTLPEVTWPTCPEKPTCPQPTFPTCPDKPTWPEWDWPEWDWPEWDWPEWDWPDWEKPECPEWPEWPDCPEWPEWPTCPEWTWPTCPEWTWPTCPEWTWPTCPDWTWPTCPSVTEPSETVTEPSEIVTEPSEIVTEPSEIVTEPSEIVTEPSEIVTEPSEEVTDPSEETTEATEATKKPVGPVEPPVKTGDIVEQLMVWGGIALVCLIALVALTVAYTRIDKKEKD